MPPIKKKKKKKCESKLFTHIKMYLYSLMTINLQKSEDEASKAFV